jgi:hypothetical protein
MIVAVGCPTALEVGQIGSAMGRIDSEIPSLADPSEEVLLREAGTDSAGGRGAGVDQQDGSSLTRAVGYLCLRKTWKSLAFRVSSKREVAGELPGLVAMEGHVNLWL